MDMPIRAVYQSGELDQVQLMLIDALKRKGIIQAVIMDGNVIIGRFSTNRNTLRKILKGVMTCGA